MKVLMLILVTFLTAMVLVGVASPASASTITLEFTSAGVPPGDNGGNSFITVNSSTDASGSNLAISKLIVSGDGIFDGTYGVTGAVAGFGALSFNTSTNFIQIVGGVSALAVPNGTTLLTGTGPFSNILVTAPPCAAPSSDLCPTVSFDAPDTKNATLLSALGITSNHWKLATFDVAKGSGNGFPQFSADVLNTQVPEPATLLFLFGAGLLVIGTQIWLKEAK